MNTTQLASEKVVVSAPMSFHGSAVRIWKITNGSEGGAKWAVGTLAVLLIALAWTLVLCWYLIFGILVIPYRLIRRGSRKRKQQALQHQELLSAVSGQDPRVSAPPTTTYAGGNYQQPAQISAPPSDPS